jgi:hypothetical protein
MYDEGIGMSLVPDAEAQYLGEYSSYPDDNYTTVDSAGDHSRLGCSVWNGSFGCSAELVQSGYWAEIYITGTTSGVADKAALDRHAQLLLETLASAIASSPERQPYVVTSGAFDGSALCGPEGAARTAAIWGLPTEVEYPWEWEHYGIDGVVFQRQPEPGCVFGDEASGANVGYSTLPGGAWVVDDMLARMPLDGGHGAYSQATIPGTDIALVACDSTGCFAALSYHSSYVIVQAPVGRADFEPKLAQVIADLGR